jgi:hypothetical protein
VIEQVLLAGDQLLAVRWCEEEAAALVVGEELDRQQREPTRLLEPAQLAGRDVQLVEPVRDVRVVVEVAGAARATVAARAVKALAVREGAEEKPGEGMGVFDQVGPVKATPGFGQGREREAVPGGDRLVVKPRLRTLCADLQQPSPRLLVERPAEDEAPVLKRLEQLLGRALVRPSTPSVSASCDEAKPPSGNRSSRSMYSSVCSAIRR